MAVVRKIPARVSAITQHTADLFTLIVTPERRTPRYKAGQFLHLALDPYDPSSHWPESRAFSIANSPTRPDEIRIVFSVKGAFTKRMTDELRQGTSVWLKMPYGSFCIAPEKDTCTVLIAGGTGITPFVSFLELACDSGEQGGIRLFYGARSRRHLIFEKTVRECEARLPDFKAWIFAESIENMDGMDCLGGSLQFDFIWDLLSCPTAATYYLSGPPSMLTAFSTKLAEQGVHSEKIRTDDWM